MFQSKRILVIGDVMLDKYYHGKVDRISPEAPVPILEITHTQAYAGGAGTVVRNITSLGASCAFLCVVGDDRASHELTNLIGQIPNCSATVVSHKNRKTTVKTRHIAGHHQVARVDYEDIHQIDERTSDAILAAFWDELPTCDAVVISDYCKGLITPKIADTVSHCGLPVVVDSKNRQWRMFSGATVITPNEREFDLAERSGFDGEVLLTRGPRGMTLGETDIPATAQQVYDVTGAGDTVAAVLSLGLASGQSLLEAAKLANKAAGIVVGKIGTATVTAEELCDPSRP